MRQLRHLGHAPAPVIAEGVESYCFASDEQEMRWVLKRIKQQLAHEKCAANRIVVAVRDFSLYSGLRQLADEYGVPVSLPQTTALVSQRWLLCCACCLLPQAGDVRRQRPIWSC